VLDNHTVDLGAQDKELDLQVDWHGPKKHFWLFPDSLILNLTHPCGENSLATSVCTWNPNNLAHLLSVIGSSSFNMLIMFAS
jgi:hypothetical protein